MRNSVVGWGLLLSTIVSMLAVCQRSQASTFLSTPTFTPAAKAPLAGVLQVNTLVNTRVSVVVSDGTNVWEKDFYDFGTTHSETLLGFRPGRTNLIQVTAYDANRNAYVAPQLLTFVTAPLPVTFPTSTVLQSNPSMMEPGYTLFIIENKSSNKFYITMMNNAGEVVWYCPAPVNFDLDVLQLDNGDLFITEDSNRFTEINMLGQIVNTWLPPVGLPIDIHGGVPTSHGTILYLTDVTNSVPNFPTTTASNAPLATVKVENNPVVEISMTNAALLNTWTPANLLNPTRITYLTYDNGPAVADNEHANAVLEDPSDNSIIVSMRDQNAVIKFSRTGQLKWILGPPANWGPNFQQYLFTPVGAPFAWNYAQHAPMLTPQGTIVLYDDGNYRASPFDPPVLDQNNYSRAVEFSLNVTNMQVSQVWDSTKANEDVLYTPAVGKTQWLPQRRNILTTYGDVTYINGFHPSTNSANATMVRLIEYTHDPVPQVVFDLSFFDYTNKSPSYLGYFMYRSTRIPDLYVHPVVPVTNFVLNNENNIPCLDFSADPTLNYVVQASTDLKNWTTIGSATQTDGIGDFEFDDLNGGQFPSRFYRVVSQQSQ